MHSTVSPSTAGGVDGKHILLVLLVYYYGNVSLAQRAQDYTCLTHIVRSLSSTKIQYAVPSSGSALLAPVT